MLWCTQRIDDDYGQRINPWTAFPLWENNVNSKGQKPKCHGSTWLLRSKTPTKWIQLLIPDDEKKRNQAWRNFSQRKIKNKQPWKECLLVNPWFGSGVYIYKMLSLFFRGRNSGWEKLWSPILPNGLASWGLDLFCCCCFLFFACLFVFGISSRLSTL